MFERIVDFSLKNRAAVLFATAAIAIWGWLSFRSITIEAFPDPTDTQVNVITLFPGQPTEEVERQVGLPIERGLNGTPGLARLRNLSLFGLSYVTLTFNDGVDPLFARQQVLERLREVDLPEGVLPELGPLATPIGEIYRYSVDGAHGDPMKRRTLQDWVVAPALLRVDGVADVVSYGGLVREIHVQPDPAKLAAFDLTFDDLEKAIRAGSVNASGGVLEHGSEQFVLRSQGLFQTLDDLRQVHVATREGVPVFLADVASVSEGWAPRQGVVGRGADDDAVEGIVLMRRGENPSEVLERVRAAVAQVNERLAADDARVTVFYDRTELVDTTLHTVGHNLLEGALLVIIVLFAFLVNLRAALIVSVLIPLSLLTAFIYLKLRGLSANLLSMGAVDFGIIVDGAVVIIESVMHHVQTRHVAATDAEPPSPDAMMARIRAGCVAVIRPTVFALLIIIAAYLPIFLLQRVEGRIFAPMANTVVAALVGALLFSVTLVPVLCSFAFRKPVAHRESPILTWATRAYEPTLRWALGRPALVLALAIAILGGTLALVPKLGSDFLPELNEGALYLTFTLPPNSSLTEGRRLAPAIREIVAGFPEVADVLFQLGRPEDGTDATLTNNLEYFVKLRRPEEWPADTRDLGELIRKMSDAVAVVPGLEVNFSLPIRDNVNENISGQFGQIAVKLYGTDLAALQDQAEKTKNVIADVPGVADLGIVKSSEAPQVQVTPNRAALARWGLDVGDFQRLFQMALGGRTVGEFWDGERRFDVALRLPVGVRDDLEKIRKLRIPVDKGVTVPLEELATVGTGFGRASISRENGRRYIGIRMNVRGRDMGSFVKDAQARVQAEAPLQPGMSIEWGGEFENKERAMQRLKTVVPVALLLTLGLLFNAFGSFGLAVLTLANVPFALVGGVLALWASGMTFSVAAAVGFIALIGQASLNGVLVLSAVDQRRRAGEPLEQAILRGCRERLRPVLMTAALAALGLIPAAMSRAIGSETQRPIAAVIVAGTVSACALALVVLPVAYKLFLELEERLGITRVLRPGRRRLAQARMG